MREVIKKGGKVPDGAPPQAPTVRERPPEPPPWPRRSKASIDIEVEVAVKAMVVRPGDTLVLIADARRTMAETADLVAGIEDHLVGVKCVVVDSVDQALVYRPAEVTHRCPPEGEAVTPCCGRTPFELLPDGRLTVDDALVTCKVVERPDPTRSVRRPWL